METQAKTAEQGLRFVEKPHYDAHTHNLDEGARFGVDLIFPSKSQTFAMKSPANLLSGSDQVIFNMLQEDLSRFESSVSTVRPKIKKRMKQMPGHIVWVSLSSHPDTSYHYQIRLLLQ